MVASSSWETPISIYPILGSIRLGPTKKNDQVSICCSCNLAPIWMLDRKTLLTVTRDRQVADLRRDQPGGVLSKSQQQQQVTTGGVSAPSMIFFDISEILPKQLHIHTFNRTPFHTRVPRNKNSHTTNETYWHNTKAHSRYGCFCDLPPRNKFILRSWIAHPRGWLVPKEPTACATVIQQDGSMPTSTKNS